jgi:hypothetical protein
VKSSPMLISRNRTAMRVNHEAAREYFIND